MASTVVVLGVLVGATIIALLFMIPLLQSLQSFLKELPDLVTQLKNSSELGFLNNTGTGDRLSSGSTSVSSAVPDAVGALLGFAGSLASCALDVFLLTFICLFFLCEVDDLKAALASVLPKQQEAVWLPLWDRITTMVSRWAIGVVIIATIAGTTQGVTAWLLGSSYAAALGLIAGLLDMIPNIGATIAGFVLSLTLLAEEGLTAALIMLAVVLVYQQVENNLLTPTIQGKAVNISAFFIIVSVALVRRAARRHRRPDRGSRRGDDPDHPRRGHEDLPRADRRDEARRRGRRAGIVTAHHGNHAVPGHLAAKPLTKVIVLARRDSRRARPAQPRAGSTSAAGFTTSGSRFRASRCKYIVGGTILQILQTTFNGLAYYGILSYAYPDSTRLWPVITAYAVGVSMNNFLPANIGTFVTLLMFVAIIPGSTFPGILAAYLVNKIFFTIVGGLVYAYMFIEAGCGVRCRARLVPRSPGAASSGLRRRGRVPARHRGSDPLAQAPEAVGAIEAGWQDPRPSGRLHEARPPALNSASYAAKVGVIIVFLAAYAIPVTFDSVMSVIGSSSAANMTSVTPGAVGITQAANVVALKDYTDADTATAYSLSQQLVTTAVNAGLRRARSSS